MANDSQLLKLFSASRDETAFTEIVSKYGGMVYGVCRNILRDTETARDVTQEVFLELAKHCAKVNSSLPGWLHRAAVNRSYSALRRRGLDRKAVAQLASETHDTEHVDWEVLAPVLNGAIEELPDQFREPIVMHYLTGLDQTAIAGQLGIDQSTVSRRIASGLEKLRKNLQKVGLCVSAGALVLSLERNAMADVAPELLDSIVRTAVEAVRNLPAPPVGGAVTGKSLFFGGKTMLKVAIICLVGTITASFGFGGGATAPTQTIETSRKIPEAVSPLLEDKSDTKSAAEEEKRIKEWLHSKSAIEHEGTVAGLIELLSKMGNVTIVVGEGIDTDRELNLNLPETQISNILDFVASAIIASWELKDNKLHFVSAAEEHQAMLELKKKFTSVTKFTVTDMPLEEAVEALTKQIGLEVSFELEVEGTVTCDMEAPGHRILDYILGMHYRGYMDTDGVVWITIRKVSPELKEALAVRHTLDTEGVTVGQLLKAIEEASGLTIFNEHVLDVEAKVPAALIKDMPLQDTLGALTQLLGCGWEPHIDAIHLSQFRPAWNDRISDETAKAVNTVLSAEFARDFNGETLHSILKRISDAHGISFRIAHGGDLKVHLKHHGTLHELLDAICKAHGLKWGVVNGVIVIHK